MRPSHEVGSHIPSPLHSRASQPLDPASYYVALPNGVNMRGAPTMGMEEGGAAGAPAPAVTESLQVR
jgi:hypothetical protein